MRTEPTRRLMLAAAGAGSLTLAGCKGIAILGPRPTPDPDVVALRHAISAEELLIARYRAALDALDAGGGHAGTGNGTGAAGAATQAGGAKAHRGVIQVVTAVLAEHQAHLGELRARLVLPPRLATASPRPSPTPPTESGGRHHILEGLATAEAAASDRLIAQLAVVPPTLAQLMASIAASEAAHVVQLGFGRLAP